MTRLLLLDNAVQGLRYLFSFEWKSFANFEMACMQASRVSLCWRSTPAFSSGGLPRHGDRHQPLARRAPVTSPLNNWKPEERTEPLRVLAVTTSPPLPARRYNIRRTHAATTKAATYNGHADRKGAHAPGLS
ncbi:hypothetical protein MTO96_018079 [Rhipicephalus appendiculatus]